VTDTNAWGDLAARLAAALKPVAPPIGIAFVRDAAATLPPPFAAQMPPPNAAGRTGAVPAGCVFWMQATERAFSTAAADHANCSVGSYTHGFLGLEEAATRDDVAAVLASGWVDEAAMASLPVVRERPARVVYGPLAELGVAPDVVLLRLNGLGLMTLKDAVPALRIEGKPQCHIIALAEQGEVAASVGCALSRARTGMRADEMTCALPAARLAALVDAIEAAAELDRAMARYAGGDAQRFARTGC
jgi:uncharacterized protein (DUF169 family)